MIDHRHSELLKAYQQEAPHPLRKIGAKDFSSTGLPHKKVTSWRHTSLEALRGDYRWQSNSQDAPPHPSSLPELLPERIVFFNGKLCPSLCVLEPNCQLASLSQEEALETLPPLLKGQDGLMALALAYYQEAHKIDIMGKLKRPLGLYHLFDQNFDGFMAHPLLSLEVHQGASGELYELTLARDSLTSALYNAHSFLRLKEKSSLNHLRVFESTKGLMPFSYMMAQVEGEASYQNTALALGGRFLRNQIQTALNHPGAQTTLNGLYIHKDRDDSSHFSRIEHRAPDTTSSQLYKGLLKDHSHTCFDGGISVAKDCPRIDSSQLNKTLLLSPTARVDSIPQLTIGNSDVKCTHGSTIGQLNHDQIFYLQSRGLGHLQAQKILGRAFCQDVIAKIDSPALEELSLQHLSDHHV